MGITVLHRLKILNLKFKIFTILTALFAILLLLLAVLRISLHPTQASPLSSVSYLPLNIPHSISNIPYPLSPIPFTSDTSLPILLGVIPEGYITQSVINEMLAMDSWAGKKASIAAVSIDIEDPNPTVDIGSQLDLLWNNGYTPFVNLMAGVINPNSQPSAYQIAAGSYDTALINWAQGYSAWAQGGKWAFIAILPEMNVEWYSYSMDPANYILAYTHIRQVFSNQGVPPETVRWVYAPNGWYNVYPHYAYDDFDDYYPGDAWVDIIAFSAFNFGYCPISPLYWQDPQEVFSNSLTAMRQLSPSKSVFISQTGTSAYISSGITSPTAKNQWLVDAYSYLGKTAGIQAVIYSNTNYSWSCDWAVFDPGGSSYSGYQTAATDPAYGYVSPSALSQADFTLDLLATRLPLLFKSFQWWGENLPVLLGVYTGDWLADQDVFDVKLHALDDWAGKRLSLTALFVDIEEENPETHITQQLDMIWANGYVPFVNLTTSTRTAAQIANGAADVGLHALAQAYKVYTHGGKRVAFLAPLQEMDGYWTSYGLDPTNFKRAYKHIQDIFAAEGVPEDSVYWVFAATGYESNKYPPFEDYYPGDAYVDVVGFSSYNFGYCPISSNNDPTWRTPKQLMNKHITRMNDMAPSKPVFIAQLGSSSYISQGVMDDEVKSQWLTDAYNYLADQSSVRGVIYFNFDKENECDWAFYKTWDDNQRKLEGYREGIANPAYGYVWPFEIRYNIFFNTTP